MEDFSRLLLLMFVPCHPINDLRHPGETWEQARARVDASDAWGAGTTVYRLNIANNQICRLAAAEERARACAEGADIAPGEDDRTIFDHVRQPAVLPTTNPKVASFVREGLQACINAGFGAPPPDSAEGVLPSVLLSGRTTADVAADTTHVYRGDPYSTVAASLAMQHAHLTHANTGAAPSQASSDTNGVETYSCDYDTIMAPFLANLADHGAASEGDRAASGALIHTNNIRFA